MRAWRCCARFCASPYRVLDVSITATPEQIELAVQGALRRAGFAFGRQPRSPAQQIRVREIFEAYATLSLERNRGAAAAFVPKRPTPESFVPAAEAGEALRRSELDTRRLTMQRYNVNSLGRYRGGPPRKHAYARGSALGEPGEYHSLSMQNELEGNNASSDFHVTRQDVLELHRYRLDDEEARLIKPTYFFASPQPFSARRLRVLGRVVAAVVAFLALGRVLQLYARYFPPRNLVADEQGVLRVASAAPAPAREH